MSPEIRLVKGCEHADAAAAILSEAWPAPSLNYSPEYMHWQLSFPSPAELPSVLALEGPRPIGFGAITGRRIRCGEEVWQSGIVSFIAVRPAWRGRGLSHAIYSHLLKPLSEAGLPIVTFGAQDSLGSQIISAAYERAGFEIVPLETCAAFSYLVRKDGQMQDRWSGAVEGDTAIVTRLAPLFSERALIGDPDSAQLDHYRKSPLRRALVRLVNTATGSEGCAWICDLEYAAANGTETIVSVDSVYLPDYDASALPALFRIAAEWSGKTLPQLVTASNLSGFDPEALRRHGIRKTGRGFTAFSCFPANRRPADVKHTNIEIV